MAKIMIIGAGASGLMAAISAAEHGAEATVLEHKSEAGIKLSITGNGRCNYTNTDVSVDRYYCDTKEKRLFVEAVLSQFGYEDCIAFFRRIGIEPEIRHYGYDESGYVYPRGMDAAGFCDVMHQAAVERGVKFLFDARDEDIAAAVRGSFTAENEETKANHKTRANADTDEALVHETYMPKDTDRKAYYYPSENEVEHDDRYDAVIIATGSNAYPATGSDSSIYPLLQELGVKPYRFLPALCALYSKDEHLSVLKGRRIKTEAVLKVSDREYKSFGEVQFNEHSISGIPVMQLSHYAAKTLSEGVAVILSIDGHDYKIHRTAGFDRAQTCTGGIDTIDIDPQTMRYKRRMSKNDNEAEGAGGTCSIEEAVVSTDSNGTFWNCDDKESINLYFCGEIIDVDGECGGYNLHFAWASGYIAGRAAAEQVQK